MEVKIEDWRALFDERVRKNKDLVNGYLIFVNRCHERGVPPIFENTHLRSLLGLTGSEFGMLLSDHNYRYRKFRIPKRLGGHRIISSPIPSLLFVQKWIGDEILSKASVSEVAHGGIQGRSIVTNAREHLGAECVLKLDIKDFFGSVKFPKGIWMFQRQGYPHNVATSLAQLTFNAGSLPQGAATSPALSNLASGVLDLRCQQLGQKYGLKFTRYFDDLTFSGPFINLRLVDIVADIAGDSGFSINPKKTRLVRGRSAKYVTGISVGGERLRLPRKSRRKIRNEAFLLCKRGIKAHSQAVNERDPLIVERVLGHLAFWRQVEPENEDAIELFQSLLRLRRETDAPSELPPGWRPKPIPHLDPTPDSL